MTTLSNSVVNKNKIPCSKTPSLFQVASFMLSPIKYLEAGFALGDVFWAYAPMKSIIAASPKAMRQIFSEPEETFGVYVDDFSNGAEFLLGGKESIVLATGEEYLKKRELLIPAFRGERMQSCRELVTQVTRFLLDGKQKIIAEEVAQKITAATILSLTFGSFEGESHQTIAREFAFQLSLIESPLKAISLLHPLFQVFSGTHKKWLHSRNTFFEAVAIEAQKRRQAGVNEQEDVLSILVREGQTDQEIYCQVMTLLFAGREPTSYTLSWILYWICAIPEVKERLLAEVDSTQDFKNLPYLDAVIKEALRIYPPPFIFGLRKTKVPFKLLDWELEVGTIVYPSPYLLHHREEIYVEPKKFRPERFLEHKFNQYEYIPFGGGARGCIGAALALFELKLAVGTILSEYNVKLTDKCSVRAIRRGAILGPEKFELLVERR